MNLKKLTMEFVNRKSVHDDLKKYDYMAKDNDFIEVTEWTCGEGIDVTINDDTLISLTYGQLEAIYHLQNALRYNK